MDNNGLPDSVGELQAWKAFYELIETQCDMLRTGPRIEFSPVATVELQRVRGILHKINLKLARLGKKVKGDA